MTRCKAQGYKSLICDIFGKAGEKRGALKKMYGPDGGGHKETVGGVTLEDVSDRVN